MRHVLRQATLTSAPPRGSELPAAVPVMDAPDEAERPFHEGAGDALDPDLRHRMISEAAYYLYQERGYADGSELDDWLQAEAQIDHVAIHPVRDDVEERIAPRPREL